MIGGNGEPTPPPGQQIADWLDEADMEDGLGNPEDRDYYLSRARSLLDRTYPKKDGGNCK